MLTIEINRHFFEGDETEREMLLKGIDREKIRYLLNNYTATSRVAEAIIKKYRRC